MLKPDPFRQQSSDFGSPDSGERPPDLSPRNGVRESSLRTGSARHQGDADAVARDLFLVPAERDFAGRRREYRTGPLSVAVIALCLLLGWLVGRAGWNMAVNRAEGQSPNVPEQVLAAAQESPYPVAALPNPVVSADPSELPSSELASSAPVQLPESDPAPKAKIEMVPQDGGLVMYERGKVVFRAAPPKVAIAKAPEGNNGSPAASNPAPHTATNGYLLTRVVPRYPEGARQQRIQGPVVMNALVGKEGSVQEVRVVSGNPELVQAAVAAVRQWRFQPHLLEGNPVEFETQVTLKFSLP